MVVKGQVRFEMHHIQETVKSWKRTHTRTANQPGQ
jgi:hypothetical protein